MQSPLQLPILLNSSRLEAKSALRVLVSAERISIWELTLTRFSVKSTLLVKVWKDSTQALSLILLEDSAIFSSEIWPTKWFTTEANLLKHTTIWVIEKRESSLPLVVVLLLFLQLQLNSLISELLQKEVNQKNGDGITAVLSMDWTKS